MIGNLTCERRIKFVQEVLENLGINKKRVQMFQVSAAEASKLAEIINTACTEINMINEQESKE